MSLLQCRLVAVWQNVAFLRGHTSNRKDFLLHSNGRGGIVIYCHFLSQGIITTGIVMEKWTISYELLPLDSDWTCRTCSTHWPWSSLSCMTLYSGNEIHLYSGGGGAGLGVRSFVAFLRFFGRWWNGTSACVRFLQNSYLITVHVTLLFCHTPHIGWSWNIAVTWLKNKKLDGIFKVPSDLNVH
jgi:hypothetical protein